MSVPNTEFAWLIERSAKEYYSGPLYYAVGDIHGSESYWTTEAYKALRFAREKDASDYINAFRLANAKAVEHGWDTRWHSSTT